MRFVTPGTYTVWLRGYPSNSAGDSAYVGVGQQVVTVTGFSPLTWTWASEPANLVITQTGLITANLWMREDGLRIDRLLLTTDTTFIPTGFGPAETERFGAGTALPTVPLTRTIVYTYNNLYRLTDADYSTGENYQYEYDPVGNRLQQIIDGDTTEYLYDAANRLESLNGQPVYSFDANGNLLNSDVLTNTWDAANRLVETIRQTDQATNRLTPIYNGVNDRVGQTVDGNTTDFALDIAGGLPEVIYTSEGNSYLHLPGVIMAESATGETRYLLSDGLGSVRQGVDENGAVVAYNEFDPYGNPTLNSELGTGNYGFTGEWWQDEVGLLHLRARWYSVETGTFLSRDAVESEPPYQYVGGNPVNLTDPSGNVPWRDQVKDGEASYSCNCGWIDWTHLSAGVTLTKGIFQGLSRTGSSFNLVWGASPAYFGAAGLPLSFSISKSSNISGDTKPGVALGIYQEIQWQVEEFQGVAEFSLPIFAPIGTSVISTKPGIRSHFSEEDLPSDIIGFYLGQGEIFNQQELSPEQRKSVVKTFCRVLDEEASLKVYEAYMNELPSGGTGIGGFVRWRGWEGRLAHSCTIDGLCDPTNRRWPGTFSRIRPIRAEERGLWSIDEWKWKYYAFPITYEVASGTEPFLKDYPPLGSN